MTRAAAFVLLALPLLGCERAKDATPHDHRPHRTEAELATRVAALDALRDQIATTPRPQTAEAAPAALTNAYLALELAYGYSALGDTARANEQIAAAVAVLGGLAGDPVHATALALYRARIEAVRVQRPGDLALPAAQEVQLAKLDRVARYKIDRLREVSSALEAATQLDAADDYASHAPEHDALGALADPAARTAELARLVTAAEASDHDRVAALARVFAAAPEVADRADFERAVALIARAPEAARPVLDAEAAIAAARFERGEQVDQLVLATLRDARGTRAGLAHTVRDTDGAWAVRTSLRVARRFGTSPAALGPELAKLARAGNPRVAIAADGAQARLGGPEAGPALAALDQLRAAMATAEMTEPDRDGMVTALASAYANAPIDRALPAIASLGAFALPLAADAYDTNSHFSLAAVQVVDALVVAIAGDD